ncbi:Os08g0278966 [Oryza sativa Japonica Group]|uniref:Os08g0278966 protein n=2 Tax=Oryza sativa subsp. japonica TaxID=39947 RepID=C7J5Z7_ORYSJ|nr:Os08g0278966 [Oryza sativa Japonica Group]|eukprot:NP_001175493.1 Os08g0278966 [Oryza sativa Japonica Group]
MLRVGRPTLQRNIGRSQPSSPGSIPNPSAIMQASDRFNINSQLEHLQAKYVGTGHADLNRFEWALNIQRDSYASYIGHYPVLAYFAIAENESIGRERYNFMQKMLLPCGLPPEREED